MTDHDPCVCPVCREAGMRNNPDKVIADLRRKNNILRTALGAMKQNLEDTWGITAGRTQNWNIANDALEEAK